VSAFDARVGTCHVVQTKVPPFRRRERRRRLVTPRRAPCVRFVCSSSRSRSRSRRYTRTRTAETTSGASRSRLVPRRSRVPSPPLPSVALRRSRSLRCVSGRDAERDVPRAHSARHVVETTASPSRRDIGRVPSKGRHTLSRLETMFTTDVLLPCRLP
jgi:hypothetical protein